MLPGRWPHQSYLKVDTVRPTLHACHRIGGLNSARRQGKNGQTAERQRTDNDYTVITQRTYIEDYIETSVRPPQGAAGTFFDASPLSFLFCGMSSGDGQAAASTATAHTLHLTDAVMLLPPLYARRSSGKLSARLPSMPSMKMMDKDAMIDGIPFQQYLLTLGQ